MIAFIVRETKKKQCTSHILKVICKASSLRENNNCGIKRWKIKTCLLHLKFIHVYGNTGILTFSFYTNITNSLKTIFPA